MKTRSLLALPLLASLALTAGCSETKTTEPVASTPAGFSASPADETPSAEQTPSSTPSASSASPSTSAASSAPASSLIPAASKPAAKALNLPDRFGAWTKVEQESEGAWTVAGYGNGRTEILQVRAATGTATDGKAELAKIVGAKTFTQGAIVCGQSPTGRKTSACMRPSGQSVVLISSTDLETEEIANLMATLLEAIG